MLKINASFNTEHNINKTPTKRTDQHSPHHICAIDAIIALQHTHTHISCGRARLMQKDDLDFGQGLANDTGSERRGNPPSYIANTSHL